jgi:UDP-glucose 4-epimerase
MNHWVCMKILLTGSEGLIGKALQITLLSQNIDIQSYDHKLPHNHPSCGDILDPATLRRAVKDCEGIIHLAAVSRVIWGEKDPDLCWKTNFEGTQNILRNLEKIRFINCVI